MSDTTHLLSLSGVSKRYGGVRALSNVDFACRRGSIHAVLGENGAGKSTLIKIVAGVVQPDEGTMQLEGRTVAFPTPQAANDAGIVCIFQELSLMPDLSVADNIGITAPPRRFGMIDKRAQRRRAEQLLARVGCEDINPLMLVKSLPLSRRQMVEIAKALGRDPKLLILDEATSALTAADVERVYGILHGLRDEGLSLLYISHRMHEIEELADTCSVFRNGRHIDTFPKGARTDEQIVQMMIGREWRNVYPPKPVRNEPPPVGARIARPRLGGPAPRHFVRDRPRRGGGARRARRPGPARAAAGAVRRAARRQRRGRRRRRGQAHPQPGAGEKPVGRARADPRGPQDRGAVLPMGVADNSRWPHSAR